MKLLIQIQNGQPHEHPILLDNILDCYPTLDPDNLPDNFAWFERVPCPKLGPYDKNATSSYQFVDGIVKDVWTIEKMTESEKIDLQNKIKQEWNEIIGYESWTFNKDLCVFEPPVPYPTDGGRYEWNEATLSWINSDSGQF